MFKIIGPRSSGKTTELIKYAYEKHLILVEPTFHRKVYAMEMAKELGYDIMVIAASQMRTYHQREDYFLIDDLDDFLSAINIVGYSQTDDNERRETR